VEKFREITLTITKVIGADTLSFKPNILVKTAPFGVR